MTKRMLYALLTVFFGVVAFVTARYISSEIRAHRDWPTVKGTIVERGVVPMEAVARSFRARAVYTYEVGGKTLTNDQVYLIRGTGGLQPEMQKLVDNLPASVDVHYDPADPQASYLLVNSLGIYWLLLAFSIVLLVVGALQLLIVLTGVK
ncbi:MAG TPA: DUF3592 domain-containing protein [Kofleriaceae bacterium]